MVKPAALVIVTVERVAAGVEDALVTLLPGSSRRPMPKRASRPPPLLASARPVASWLASVRSSCRLRRVWSGRARRSRWRSILARLARMRLILPVSA
ncbi:MAG: hypothetical protein HPM95_13790 [Alphaproteobacteria bacterium]|nr:hypothetical protein [Alphaproteobacteria bacterium]